MFNDGVPYTPVDEIPLEWRPPEHSPRLKCWAPFPVDLLGLIGASLGRANETLTVALVETETRLALCIERLKGSYLEWFEPMGPPGVHAHLHYRSPQDPARRAAIQSAMVVDYEAALVFLDVALDQVAQAVGLFAGVKSSWRSLVQLSELPLEARPSWMSEDLARSIRQLQRTALYARNKAVVHPLGHYVVTRTDETGNVTYLRTPTIAPDEATLANLTRMSRKHLDLRDDVRITSHLEPSDKDDLPGVLAV